MQFNTLNKVRKERTIEVKEKNLKVDSLKEEVFNLQVSMGRYELGLEYLKESNPKAAKQFEDYLQTETE